MTLKSIFALFTTSFFYQPYVDTIKKEQNSLVLNINIRSRKCGSIIFTRKEITTCIGCGLRYLSKGKMSIQDVVLKHGDNKLIINNIYSSYNIKLKCSSEKSKKIISFWEDSKKVKLKILQILVKITSLKFFVCLKTLHFFRKIACQD